LANIPHFLGLQMIIRKTRSTMFFDDSHVEHLIFH
jgi:hypothetical protein